MWNESYGAKFFRSSDRGGAVYAKFRTQVLAILLGASLFLVVGCQRRQHANPAATIEDEGELATSISVVDPRDATQLLSGFHAVEDGAWRWSMKKFAVTLASPKDAARKGANLVLDFALPDAVAGRMMGVMVTPAVAGQPLQPCHVTVAGGQACQFNVPAALLKAEAVVVEFELDKAVEPSDSDSRQLGLVVSRIGLSSK